MLEVGMELGCEIIAYGAVKSCAVVEVKPMLRMI
jgi:hypothetical protein